MGATGAAAPIGDELLENASENDMYVEDVDDSAYVEQITETGAMAGPGYVEMPKSRFGGIFGKFRRKKREEASSPQEWLDVEESFDAREVGAARGGWESFREEGDIQAYDEEYLDADATTAFSPEFDDDFARTASTHLALRIAAAAISRVGRSPVINLTMSPKAKKTRQVPPIRPVCSVKACPPISSLSRRRKSSRSSSSTATASIWKCGSWRSDPNLPAMAA